MVEPTSKDIGRFVVYVDDRPEEIGEAGRVTSFNEAFVFVAFPKRHLPYETTIQACRRESLHWLDDLLPKG